MSIELALKATPATVTSVNNRSELHGDDHQVVGQDLDFKLQVPADFLLMLVIDNSDDQVDWNACLFDGGSMPRELSIKPIQSTLEFDDHIVTISYVESGERTKERFAEAKVKKIKFSPIAGHRIELTLQVQVHPKDAKTCGWCVAMLAVGTCNLKIEPPKQKDLLGSADDESLGLGGNASEDC